jgi:hypothetical protein
MHSFLVIQVALLGVALGWQGSSVGYTNHPSTCPAVWKDVATDLHALFVDSAGQATDDARAAIRIPFHDCFPGACDGSIILADECHTRPENTQLIPICDLLGQKATQYNVSTADTIQLAAALGIAAALGPAITFKVGRQDSSIANLAGQIPNPNATAESIVARFAAKGFSSTELVALVGTHSAAKNLAGVPLDTTVDDLDVKFYSETQDGTAPARINSDVALANSYITRSTWSGFAASQFSWQAVFVPAMEKLAVIGNDEATLTDCSAIITDIVSSR